MSLVTRTSVAVMALWGAACAFAPSASSGVSLPQPVAEPSPGQVRSGQLRAATIPTGQVASGALGGPFHIAPLGSRPQGKSYAAWIAAWWKWALETEGRDNSLLHPLLDPESSNCAAGDQPRGVRFLGGTFTGGGETVNRTCTIPSGTALFFPIVNAVWASTPATVCSGADDWYNTRPGDQAYDEDFQEFIVGPTGVAPANDPDDLTLTIDEVAAKNLTNLYLQSDIFFDVDLPGDNIFDVLSGIDCPAILLSPNVGWGYYVFLNPLPPGQYKINWTANATLPFPLPPFPDPDPTAVFQQNVTYTLTVEPGR